MARGGSIGDQELELLKYVAEHGPVSVGQAADGFGKPRGLARSTVLTMMERLRSKGRLTRKKQDAVYLYRSPASSREVLAAVVGDFVDRALAGSVSPFVGYLSDRGELSEGELAQLEALVGRLRAAKKKGGGE